MGQAAKKYLDEQRAKASPELKQIEAGAQSGDAFVMLNQVSFQFVQ
jgi:hypothetical protein